jgi:nicotinate-nucleotide adenylyltransferase
VSRVLLFGGSFNPVHHGHLIVARVVAERLDAERVVLIPCATPPHKQSADLAPAGHRVAMCRLAVQGDRLFEVSDWETRETGPNYSLLTVRHFRSELGPEAWIGWLIGMDSLAELGTWYSIGDLARECTLVTAARPGLETPDLTDLARLIAPDDLARIRRHVLETPQIEISSTDVRRRLREGRPVRYLVPATVADYLSQHRLYVR